MLRYEDGGMEVHKLHVLLDQSGYYSGEEDMVGRCRLTPGLPCLATSLEVKI